METFEDEGFVYELSVKASTREKDLHTISQGDGFCCVWTITGKEDHQVNQIKVTDDECETVVYHSLEAAVKGARDFISL